MEWIAIDLAYFKTTYFWVTTGMAIVLSLGAVWLSNKAEE
jgi:hypothetical protein